MRVIRVAAKAIEEGVGVKAVSGLLRHKNLRTTEIYLHSIDEGQRIAIDKIQGKFTPKKYDPQASPASIFYLIISRVLRSAPFILSAWRRKYLLLRFDPGLKLSHGRDNRKEMFQVRGSEGSGGVLGRQKKSVR